MKPDSRKYVVQQLWSKAEESLDSAKRELEAGAHIFAINRIYYAAFYAVTAALLERKLSFKKHSGVRTAFHQEFIKKKLLAEEWGIFYSQLFDDRQEGDYTVLSSFDREHVETQLKRCAQFLSELKPLIAIA